MVYVTGDVHGYYGRIVRFCNSLPAPTRDDVLVILGDAGANYWLDDHDVPMKEALGNLPVTVLCVHGNHEARPAPALGYHEVSWRGGRVFVDDRYPGLLFAKDGSVFNLECGSCLVAGGAYSVDKRFRLEDGRRWFADEQPGPDERLAVERACVDAAWQVDYVFSHTVPLGYRPTEAFLASIKQVEVDTSTEEWLQYLERRLEYTCWFAGHFHVNKHAPDNMWVLFKHVVQLPEGRVVYDDEADQARISRYGFPAPERPPVS